MRRKNTTTMIIRKKEHTHILPVRVILICVDFTNSVLVHAHAQMINIPAIKLESKATYNRYFQSV